MFTGLWLEQQVRQNRLENRTRCNSKSSDFPRPGTFEKHAILYDWPSYRAIGRLRTSESYRVSAPLGRYSFVTSKWRRFQIKAVVWILLCFVSNSLLDLNWRVGTRFGSLACKLCESLDHPFMFSSFEYKSESESESVYRKLCRLY